MLALDVIVRVAAATLFLVVALLVVRSGRALRLAPCLLAFALGVSGVLANNAPVPAVR